MIIFRGSNLWSSESLECHLPFSTPKSYKFTNKFIVRCFLLCSSPAGCGHFFVWSQGLPGQQGRGSDVQVPGDGHHSAVQLELLGGRRLHRPRPDRQYTVLLCGQERGWLLKSEHEGRGYIYSLKWWSDSTKLESIFMIKDYFLNCNVYENKEHTNELTIYWFVLLNSIRDIVQCNCCW